jgi:hypothetical protein
VYQHISIPRPACPFTPAVRIFSGVHPGTFEKVNESAAQEWTVPWMAPAGSWSVIVITADVGNVTKPAAVNAL